MEGKRLVVKVEREIPIEGRGESKKVRVTHIIHVVSPLVFTIFCSEFEGLNDLFTEPIAERLEYVGGADVSLVKLVTDVTLSFGALLPTYIVRSDDDSMTIYLIDTERAVLPFIVLIETEKGAKMFLFYFNPFD